MFNLATVLNVMLIIGLVYLMIGRRAPGSVGFESYLPRARVINVSCVDFINIV